jgi:hypothetical protein
MAKTRKHSKKAMKSRRRHVKKSRKSKTIKRRATRRMRGGDAANWKKRMGIIPRGDPSGWNLWNKTNSPNSSMTSPTREEENWGIQSGENTW